MSTVIFIHMPSRQKNEPDKAKISSIGEEKDFEFFFRQYYTSLCFFARNILRDEEEAKDIVQDCFLKLWDNQTSEDRSDTVKSFLYTSVRNRCIDIIRKRKTIQRAKLEIIRCSEDNFEFFDEAAFAEMVRQLNEYLSELPLKLQQIIKMYYRDGKKYQEIASEIKSTPEAVRKQKERALKIIRRRI